MLCAMHEPGWPTTPNTFLALPPHEHDLARSRLVVLPVPYDAATSYKAGARDGPAAILRASRQMEDFDPELGCCPSDVGIYTAPELEAHAGGPEQMAARVAQAVDWYAGQGKLVCMLGGDHSLTPGAVSALVRRYDDLSVLVLDAHTDLADEYQGSRYSHACAVRRVLDVAPAVLVGVRSMQQQDNDLIQRGVVTLFPRTAEPITDVEAVVSHLSPNVYVSVDLDVFDPSLMAAVGTPEPGGMGWWEVLRVLRAVASRRRIVGFDVMELAPAEGPEACAYTAAKLAYKLIGYATLPS